MGGWALDARIYWQVKEIVFFLAGWRYPFDNNLLFFFFFRPPSSIKTEDGCGHGHGHAHGQEAYIGGGIGGDPCFLMGG